MRAAHRLVLSAAALAAVAWSAARGVAPEERRAVNAGGEALGVRATWMSVGLPVRDEAGSPRLTAPARREASAAGSGARAAEAAGAVEERVAAGAPARESARAGQDAAGGGSSGAPPRLDALARRPDAATIAVSGADPLAPREVALWRIEGGRAARLASTWSAPDGRVSFGEVAAPARGLELAATAGAADEADALAAPRSALPPARAAAPEAEAHGDGAGAWRLRVRPAGPGGWLVVSALDGAEIGRVRVPMEVRAARQGLDLWLDGAGTLGAVLLAQDEPGTGRSDVRRIDLIANETEGEVR